MKLEWEELKKYKIINSLKTTYRAKVWGGWILQNECK